MKMDVNDMQEELFLALIDQKDLLPLNEVRIAEERRYYAMTPTAYGKYAAICDLTLIYADAGAYEEAIAVYKEALGNPLLKDFGTEFYFRIGQLYEHLRDFDAALEAYLKSIAEGNGNVEAQYWQHNNAAFCYLMKKDFAAAEKHCLVAFESDEANRRRWLHIGERLTWNAWKNMGVAMEHTGRLKEAASYYTTAIKLSHGYERAVLHLRRLLQRHPDLAAIWKEPVEDLFTYYKLTV